MKEIPLTRGYVALVDDEDYEELSRYKWQAANGGGKTFYARRSKSAADGPRRICIAMHREIMGVTDKGVQIDHRDGNGLNNQRANLRLCTHAENMRNIGPRGRNSTGFKGVFLNRKNAWAAYISFNQQTTHLGVFSTPEEAARHYNAAAVKLHGRFARLNEVSPMFPTQSRKNTYLNNKSGFRGVDWRKREGMWRARIQVNRKTIYLGLFTDKEAANRACEAARKAISHKAG